MSAKMLGGSSLRIWAKSKVLVIGVEGDVDVGEFLAEVVDDVFGFGADACAEEVVFCWSASHCCCTSMMERCF